MAKKMKGYEQSKYDNDKGLTEGSKADKKRDMKGMAKMKKAKGKKK